MALTASVSMVTYLLSEAAFCISNRKRIFFFFFFFFFFVNLTFFLLL